MSRFEGKLVLVTGASSGIGLATARRLASEGARIVAVARDEARLASAISSLSGDGHTALVADAIDWVELEPAVSLGRSLGGFSGAVLCAGSHEIRPISVLEAVHLRSSFDANVVTAVHGTKVVAKAPNKSGAGVVWLSSVSATRATAGFAAYSASKGALVSAARVAAVEFAARRIRVNVVLAGVVETPMSDGWLSKLSAEQRAAVAGDHLLGLGTPDDVASVASFLVSDDARWMTGAVVPVDGGLSVR